MASSPLGCECAGLTFCPGATRMTHIERCCALRRSGVISQRSARPGRSSSSTSFSFITGTLMIDLLKKHAHAVAFSNSRAAHPLLNGLGQLRGRQPESPQDLLIGSGVNEPGSAVRTQRIDGEHAAHVAGLAVPVHDLQEILPDV